MTERLLPKSYVSSIFHPPTLKFNADHLTMDCRKRRFIHRCYQHQCNDRHESNVNHAPPCRCFAVTAKKSVSEVSSARKSRRVLSRTRTWCTHSHTHTHTHIHEAERARARFDITIYVDANVNGVVNSSTQGCGSNEAAASTERFGLPTTNVICG